MFFRRFNIFFSKILGFQNNLIYYLKSKKIFVKFPNYFLTRVKFEGKFFSKKFLLKFGSYKKIWKFFHKAKKFSLKYDDNIKSPHFLNKIPKRCWRKDWRIFFRVEISCNRQIWVETFIVHKEVYPQIWRLYKSLHSKTLFCALL